VAAGCRWARPGQAGWVLLSPAAPSFGQFRDYRDRGEAFTRATHAISSTIQPTGTPAEPNSRHIQLTSLLIRNTLQIRQERLRSPDLIRYHV
jgi:hypothetical protein